MWRLIVVTFGFLGWAFYELSGGAAYAPAEGSRQYAALHKTSQPEQPAREIAAPARKTGPAVQSGARIVLASAPAQKARRNAPVSEAEKRLRLTLNAARQEASAPVDVKHGVATVAADPEKLARLVVAAGAVRPEPEVTAQTGEAAETRDLRKVKPARVNMRQGPGTDFNVVAKLGQGTEVEVLRDEGEGWVKLRVVDTGRVGWMADYLLVAAK